MDSVTMPVTTASPITATAGQDQPMNSREFQREVGEVAIAPSLGVGSDVVNQRERDPYGDNRRHQPCGEMGRPDAT